MKSTGNAGGNHNLLLCDTASTCRNCCSRWGRGLLVTELMGQGTNMVTGDYSRGAAGFWIENGVVAYPVQEITIAGNLKDMFRNIVAAGNRHRQARLQAMRIGADRAHDGGRRLMQGRRP